MFKMKSLSDFDLYFSDDYTFNMSLSVSQSFEWPPLKILFRDFSVLAQSCGSNQPMFGLT